MMKKFILFLLFASFQQYCRAEMVVVMNANSSIVNVSREQVADVFLGRSKSLANNEKIIPLESKEDDKNYIDFHENVTRKNSTQLKAHWAKMVFAGKAAPPKEVLPEEAIKLLEGSRDYIAYVDKKLVTVKMKIVFEY